MQIKQNRQYQTLILPALVQNTTPRGDSGVDHWDDYSNFLRTQLLTFTKANDPLDADHWLCTIEQ